MIEQAIERAIRDLNEEYKDKVSKIVVSRPVYNLLKSLIPKGYKYRIYKANDFHSKYYSNWIHLGFNNGIQCNGAFKLNSVIGNGYSVIWTCEDYTATSNYKTGKYEGYISEKNLEKLLKEDFGGRFESLNKETKTFSYLGFLD